MFCSVIVVWYNVISDGNILRKELIAMDEEKNVVAEGTKPKKTRRTREEVQAAMEAEDEKKMQEAEQAAKALVEDAKLLEEIKKRMESNRRKVKSGRDKARTNVGMATYSKVCTKLGFYQQEKNCQLKSDFEKLQEDILKRIAELLEKEKQLKELQK